MTRTPEGGSPPLSGDSDRREREPLSWSRDELLILHLALSEHITHLRALEDERQLRPTLVEGADPQSFTPEIERNELILRRLEKLLGA